MTYAYVSSGDIWSSGSGTTASVSPTYASGDTVFIVGAFQNTGASSATISDGTNTYVQAGSYFTGTSSLTMGLWVCYSAVAGSYTVTMTTNAACNWRGLGYFRYTGILASGYQTSTSSQQIGPATTADAVTSGNVTPSSQPAILLGISVDQNGSVPINAGTADSPASRSTLTSWRTGIGFYSQVEDYRLTATSAVSTRFTATTSGANTLSIAAVFSESSGPTLDPITVIFPQRNRRKTGRFL